MATATARQQGSEGKPAMRKPVFVKVDQLKPGTSGHTLTVKVLESKTVMQKGRAASAHLRQTMIAECIVGDETGTVIFTARNNQGGLAVMARFVRWYWGISINPVFNVKMTL